MLFLLLIYIVIENWSMSQYVRKRIAKNVKYFRELNSYTRESLSLILEFENSYISKVENCNINITIDRLAKIADIFKIDVIELLK